MTSGGDADTTGKAPDTPKTSKSWADDDDDERKTRPALPTTVGGGGDGGGDGGEARIALDPPLDFDPHVVAAQALPMAGAARTDRLLFFSAAAVAVVVPMPKVRVPVASV